MLNLLNIIWSVAGYVPNFFFAGIRIILCKRRVIKPEARSTKPCSTEKDDNQSRNQLSWTGVLGKLNLELNQLSQRKPDCVELCPRGRLWDQTSELDRLLTVLSGWTEECSVLFQANKEWKLEENKWFKQSQIWGEALQTEAELWSWRFGEMEEMLNLQCSTFTIINFLKCVSYLL